MKSNKNFLFFFTASFLLFAGWLQLKETIWPTPKKAATENTQVEEKVGPEKVASNDSKDAAAGFPYQEKGKLIKIGSAEKGTPYHLGVTLDSVGACVREVVLNKFQHSDHMGIPVWEDAAKKQPKKLQLMPLNSSWHSGANFLFHFDEKDQVGDQPLDLLSNVEWKCESGVSEVDKPDGGKLQRVEFETQVGNLKIRKIYSLGQKEYHLGLELQFSVVSGDVPSSFRYQLTGSSGLPIEGQWYTNTFRNALVAQVDERKNIYRDLQDARQIANWFGGSELMQNASLGHWFRYAGVAVQYFASMVVVDDEQQDQKIIEKVRPTLELASYRGMVLRVDKSKLQLAIRNQQEESLFWFSNSEQMKEFENLLLPGARVSIQYRHVASPDRVPYHVVAKVTKEMDGQPLFDNDVTVRLTSKIFQVNPGKTVSHKYLLYHGPVKAALLGDFSGEESVNPDQVARYVSRLGLNTLTDYPSPGWIGSFCSSIFWTDLLIKCTNLMHWVLWKIYLVIPNFGICIILLTVLVRGMMFPLSRKQALMTIKMQQIAPELKKLQEKFKEDKQGLGVAQMELYRKHGVNPFGTCWVVLIQMPIFMGLYFSLQESIHFRLAPFWPSWIINLAAPDMLLKWGESIPFISRPEDYGGFLYLGPYFNLLPIFAITLMIVQQKMFTPPPTDEQQEAQQKMMTYMMVFMGLMFYKVAAGLCIYFIASSLWGLAERRLLPKSQLALAGAPVNSPVLENKKSGKRENKSPATNPSKGGGLLQRLKDWVEEVQKQAEKK